MPFESPYPLTRGLKALLIATGAVFVLQFLPVIGPLLDRFCTLVAQSVFIKGEIWRLSSYMFMHSTAGIFHLLFNMLALWMFGGELEERWGTRKFVTLYFLFGIGSALFSALYLFDPGMRFTPIIGASGAVMGLLTAFAIYNPERQILLFFVIPIRAWIMVVGFAVVSLLMAFTQGGGVAHLVHLGGIAVAFAYLKGWPAVEEKIDEYRELEREKTMRNRAEESASRKRYFDEKIDPILEKISKSGMASLTKEEKKLLGKAGKFKEEMKSRKIVPIEVWRRKR
jgi:membrane associated rhomboid family serine protease